MWYDNIDRRLLDSGEIEALINDGIRGLTSNPAIFQKAITSSDVYDQHIMERHQKGDSASEIYEALAVADIQRAADLLRALYDETGGDDGYVSIEVSPLLADSTEATIEEAKRLNASVDRPNVMVKIPATPAGLPAIEEAIAAGLNINITLIFSREVYAEVMDAYMRGLERRIEAGEPIDSIASVASFFVSRVDVMVDKMLMEKVKAADSIKKKEELQELTGGAGIANAKLAYQLFEETFSTERWQAIAAAGGNVQRPLWASTSTKNPDYPDTMYVDALIGPQTVNTAPPDTIEAFRERGIVAVTIDKDMQKARDLMARLSAAGINMKKVTDDLLEEGVEKFEKPFNNLLDSIEEKRNTLVTS
jgi:transaldolase